MIELQKTTNKEIFVRCPSGERNMLVAKQGIQPLIRRYARHNISADGGTCIHRYVDSQILNNIIILNLKTFIERTIQYIKDRTGFFDFY